MNSQRESFLFFAFLRTTTFAVLVASLLSLTLPAFADEGEKAASMVEKAARRSTLDQAGTHPFHLKATLAPSRERDKESGRTGDIEIWWDSPTRYRRELRSPGFHRIEVVNGAENWQKNEGNYFPHWLDEVAVALIRPLPPLEHVLKMVREADVRHMAGNMYCQWSNISTDGTAKSGIGSSVAVNDSTGLIFYAGEPGWGGLYKDYANFHGRQVARTVSTGSPEVTAKIVVLEDLKNPPADLFDTAAPGADSHPFSIVNLDEATVRRTLLQAPPIAWPTVDAPPFEGAIGAEIVIDREGRVREVPVIVSDNRALAGTAHKALEEMRFTPFLLNGSPVEVFARITLAYKTSRPAGMEDFAKAGEYFTRGRRASSPAAAAKSPYVLKATFIAILADHSKGEGEYEDTWASSTQWRREARVGKSRYVRARNGENWYKLEEGPDALLLALVLQFIEPIPTLDTYTESDWHMKRETIGGTPALRILSGAVTADDKPEGEHARAYWFDSNNTLLQSYTNSLYISGSDFAEANGARLPRQILVKRDGRNIMVIRMGLPAPVANIADSTFKLKGHEWRRAFTSEER